MSSAGDHAVTQNCPACGAGVDVTEVEPLARVSCPSCGEKVRADRAFDHFVLLETLGVGGMGSVYKARDTRLDRLVALKILRSELSAQPGETDRLEQEARLTAAVNHPNIVQVFSSGNDRHQFYLVMELVDYGSLDDLIAEHGKLPEAQVLEIGLQVAHGLQAAQEKGLIHRDIKPANILFANERSAKIGDFGLAVAAEQNAGAQKEIWGTPYYVAPERLNNDPEDFRSDIFSLGATLFHAISGSPPIEGESTSATELRELKSHPPELRAIAPDLSRSTVRVIERMIAPDPHVRFQSYAEVIGALQRAKESFERGGRPALLSARNMIAAVLVLLSFAAAAAYVYRAKTRAMAAMQPAAGDMNLSLKKLYDDARRELIAGKYDVARTTFTRLGEQAQNRQPILNWIRLHRGLAALLRGYTTQARQAFEEAEKGGMFSTKPEEAGLAKFFIETAHRMVTPKSIPATAGGVMNPNSPTAFATFLFAMKDWQQGDFAPAVSLLEQFARSESTGAFGWINDYKPLAQKYLLDYRTFADWKARPQNLDAVAGIKEALAGLRSAQAKLHQYSRLSEAFKDEESSLLGRLGERQKLEGQSPDVPEKKTRPKEASAWQTALAAYRAKVAAYDFAGALSAVTAVQPPGPALRSEQEMLMKRANWLAEWKQQFMEDLRRAPLVRAVTDNTGSIYKGISSAEPDRLSLMLPYGAAAVSWPKLTPKSLLDASSAFIVPGSPDCADRQWRCAIFASETGQPDSARALGEAAAKAKPEYTQHLPLISGMAPTNP